MDRIDRQPRGIKKTISLVSEGQHVPRQDIDGGETASHWLSSAMAMWIQQDEAQTRADREGGHAETNTR